MNTIDKIREIKKKLDVDILAFTVAYAGMKSQDINKMEAILYKNNVYVDKDELNTILNNIRDKVASNRSKLAWDISDLENQLNHLNDKKEKLDKVSDLNY
ncbi:hypothetical protein K2V52_13050 [Staphylococcus nepalensis]|uniref:hypothetical protein n=1 Tax=Staphylococcus nepalensis TaxID=214473 RepID=UPI001E29FFAF|nr:hypothetical protein [Staphylococcus nepalensis]MCD8892891.1 hypothetical protein [Staphylococcus nepalensis]